MVVSNRWGEIVFESFDLNKGWDGTYKGNPQNPGVYVYYVDVKFCDGYRLPLSDPLQKGSVTLIK